MPMDINLERLDDGTGIESTLRAHRSEWHKKCRLQFNKKAFDEQSRRELAEGQQFECASAMQTYLLTDIHSPLSPLASSEMSLLVPQVYIRHQPTTLTQMCGGMLLKSRTVLCWPSLQQET